MRSNEDASFLRSVPNGVLEEFRAEVCLRFTFKITAFDSFLPVPTQTYPGSFVKKNPTMFVDTTWVDIDSLREFLREREVSVYTKDFFLVN
jgi:hypothetical protein